MLLSQNRITTIFTVKFEDSCEGHFNWKWTKLHCRVMQWIYVYFTDYVLSNNGFFKMILLHTLEQNFIILRHLVGEISHLQYDAYYVISRWSKWPKKFCGWCIMLLVYFLSTSPCQCIMYIYRVIYMIYIMISYIHTAFTYLLSVHVCREIDHRLNARCDIYLNSIILVWSDIPGKFNDSAE